MSAAGHGRARRFATLAVVLQALLVVGGWLYRATLYHRIPVARGDPYGLGDLIDLGFFFLLLATSTLAVAGAILCAAVPSLRNWKAVAVLAAAGVLATPIYRAVHPLLP